MQQHIGLAATPDHQGAGDELCCHLSLHQPTDHAPRDRSITAAT
jgi:hypothetical protein